MSDGLGSLFDDFFDAGTMSDATQATSGSSAPSVPPSTTKQPSESSNDGNQQSQKPSQDQQQKQASGPNTNEPQRPQWSSSHAHHNSHSTSGASGVVSTLATLSTKFENEVSPLLATVGTLHNPLFLSAQEASQYGVPSTEILPAFEVKNGPMINFLGPALNFDQLAKSSIICESTAYLENTPLSKTNMARVIVPILEETPNLHSTAQKELLYNLMTNTNANSPDEEPTIDIDALWNGEPSSTYTDGKKTAYCSVVDEYSFAATFNQVNAVAPKSAAHQWFNTNLSSLLYNSVTESYIREFHDIDTDGNPLRRDQREKHSSASAQTEMVDGGDSGDANNNINTLPLALPLARPPALSQQQSARQTTTYYSNFSLSSVAHPVRALLQRQDGDGYSYPLLDYSLESATKPNPDQSTGGLSGPPVITTSKAAVTTFPTAYQVNEFNPLTPQKQYPVAFATPFVTYSCLNDLPLPWPGYDKIRMRFGGCADCGDNHRVSEGNHADRGAQRISRNFKLSPPARSLFESATIDLTSTGTWSKAYDNDNGRDRRGSFRNNENNQDEQSRQASAPRNESLQPQLSPSPAPNQSSGYDSNNNNNNRSYPSQNDNVSGYAQGSSYDGQRNPLGGGPNNYNNHNNNNYNHNNNHNNYNNNNNYNTNDSNNRDRDRNYGQQQQQYQGNTGYNSSVYTSGYGGAQYYNNNNGGPNGGSYQNQGNQNQNQPNGPSSFQPPPPPGQMLPGRHGPPPPPQMPGMGQGYSRGGPPPGGGYPGSGY